ncbi:MAG: choline/ethanolamine kinase family protein [Cocleimonas sp.]
MNKVTNSIINKIPELSGCRLDQLNIQRLGGLTNLVYRIHANDKDYVLRLPGEGTEAYIDRAVEAHNAKQAANADVSAKVYYFDKDSGLMLADFLLGETMTPESFKQRAGSPTRAGIVMKKLHTSGKTFQFRFELFNMIDEYLKTVTELDVELPDDYHQVLKQAEPIRKALQQNPVQLAPCHCDPLAENFLDNGERMWMIDWEYSGMNDPMWDLGDLSEEAGFSQSQDAEMLSAYCNGNVTANHQGRMIIYKAMSDLLWTLWGLIQHANNNPVDNFWSYALNKFERCKLLMGQDEFNRHIAALK